MLELTTVLDESTELRTGTRLENEGVADELATRLDELDATGRTDEELTTDELAEINELDDGTKLEELDAIELDDTIGTAELDDGIKELDELATGAVIDIV